MSSADREKERERSDQIVRECFAKVTQVVLQSRVVIPPQAARKQSKWFNLDMEDVEGITEELAPWQRDPTLPLIIDIHFEPPNRRPTSTGSKDYALLEHWKLTYDGQPPSAGAKDEVPTVYKKTVLLIRSLYSYLRIMPAHSLVRALKKNKMTSAHLIFTIKPYDTAAAGASPFGTAPAAEHRFMPVETPYGRIALSVMFRTECSFRLNEFTENIIIQDYAPTSPTAADNASLLPRKPSLTNLAKPIPPSSEPIPIQGRSQPRAIPSSSSHRAGRSDGIPNYYSHITSPPASMITAPPSYGSSGGSFPSAVGMLASPPPFSLLSSPSAAPTGGIGAALAGGLALSPPSHNHFVAPAPLTFLSESPSFNPLAFSPTSTPATPGGPGVVVGTSPRSIGSTSSSSSSSSTSTTQLPRSSSVGNRALSISPLKEDTIIPATGGSTSTATGSTSAGTTASSGASASRLLILPPSPPLPSLLGDSGLLLRHDLDDVPPPASAVATGDTDAPFASASSKDADGDIGAFVRACQAAPPLPKLFDATSEPALFLWNDDLSKFRELLEELEALRV